MAAFEHDTWLYHGREGARLFRAGEDDPGPGWFDHPVGPPTIAVSEGSGEGAAKRVRRKADAA